MSGNATGAPRSTPSSPAGRAPEARHQEAWADHEAFRFDPTIHQLSGSSSASTHHIGTPPSSTRPSRACAKMLVRAGHRCPMCFRLTSLCSCQREKGPHLPPHLCCCSSSPASPDSSLLVAFSHWRSVLLGLQHVQPLVQPQVKLRVKQLVRMRVAEDATGTAAGDQTMAPDPKVNQASSSSQGDGPTTVKTTTAPTGAPSPSPPCRFSQLVLTLQLKPRLVWLVPCRPLHLRRRSPRSRPCGRPRQTRLDAHFARQSTPGAPYSRGARGEWGL